MGLEPRHVASRTTADVDKVRAAPRVPHESCGQRDQVVGERAMIARRVCPDYLVICGLYVSRYVCHLLGVP